MNQREVSLIKNLYKKGIIRVLVVIRKMCWNISDLSCHIALILDAESYDSVEKRFVEYPLSDVLQMQSLAKINYTTKSGKSIDPKCSLFCHSPRKDYFLKFM